MNTTSFSILKLQYESLLREQNFLTKEEFKLKKILFDSGLSDLEKDFLKSEDQDILNECDMLRQKILNVTPEKKNFHLIEYQKFKEKAKEHGMTVNQFKKYRKIQKENNLLKKKEEQEKINSIVQKLTKKRR